MGRIRSIKPEFPQSESMGRVSRDARLLFIQLWTLADDSGRTRAASRMLASLLYPYDDDAPRLIEHWLDELDREGCIIRYKIDGQTYLEICNWFEHQKIDKPSASKIPPFVDGSRILANPRESSSGEWNGLDQGLDQGEEKREAPAEAVAPFVVTEVLESEEAEEKSGEKKSSPPSSPPLPLLAHSPKPPADPLRAALQESFVAKVKTFASWPKEGENLTRLAKAIRAKSAAEDVQPETAAQGMLETYWRLHESGKPFWASFTPSKMLSAFEDLWALWRKEAAAGDLSWMDKGAAS